MAKRERNLSSEMDMTPFIDMTFQLIIFFIVANDLSQKELEDLKLPAAHVAVKDEPDPGRPILNILEDGTVKIKSKPYYYPGIDSAGYMDPSPSRKGRPDYYWRLAEYLAVHVVPNMSKRVDPEFASLGELPDDPLLIRADRNTPWKYIARVMEVCTRQNIKIWRIQLAASQIGEGAAAGPKTQ